MYTKEQVLECMKWYAEDPSYGLEYCFLKGTGQSTKHLEHTLGPDSILTKDKVDKILHESLKRHMK